MKFEDLKTCQIIVLFFLLILCCVSVSQGIVCLEDVGHSSGNGTHVLTLDITGYNLTDQDATVVLMAHGYNITENGYVTINDTTWHVIRCENNDMTEIDKEV